MLRPCCRKFRLSVLHAPRHARHFELAAQYGLRPAHEHGFSLPVWRARADAHVTAWRHLAWDRELRIPLGESAHPVKNTLVLAAANEIVLTRLPSRLRGTSRHEFRCRFPFSIRAWTIDEVQDLAILVEDAAQPPYPCHVLSLSTGQPHPLAERMLPPLVQESAMNAEASVRIHDEFAGIVNAGRLSVWNWRTGVQLLDIDSEDDFCFLDDEHVLTVLFDWETLCARICVHAFRSENSNRPPRLTFALPRLRTSSSSAEVFVRLNEQSAYPFAQDDGMLVADPSDRALFVTTQVVATSARGTVRGATFCVPLSFLAEYVRDTTALSDDAEFEVPWAEWGPEVCGAVPDTGSMACFGTRAARSVPASVAGVELEVFDFHPGRVELARRSLPVRGGKFERGQGEKYGHASAIGAGWFTVQRCAKLDGRLFDEEDARAMPGLPYIVSRRHVPDPWSAGGRVLLTEDALLYMPRRDPVTSEPAEYQAFVF
ncbi:hypothetical protein K488DRAFT_88493 [Vararia minispora EC-137]|uniref:Uncharacterized protein n=1 Tax=Vararia minispora EC-137 TaxID=1314806 RepID=A0ACB8QEE8_9AGAM|nr:hypothetical protein K488DRAFT_88493 [Vararia minispora EC-137]